MSQNEKLFLVDAGNSYLKLAEVRDGNIMPAQKIPFTSQEFREFTIKHKEAHKVISSVLSKAQTKELTILLEPCTLVTQTTALPIKINYESPQTLGIDRICNACAIYEKKSGENALCIDIGTCIKFDLVQNNCYVGGSISPGIDLRYRALHEFTGKLPLIHDKLNSPITGNSSIQSIHSGVMNGIQKELEGFINYYRSKYADLSIFITGGDAPYFDFEGKNDIFAIENLTLQGLYAIYTFDAK